jgi:L-ascorbate metabolism protein UlaG (beta-lactamase superfamily)
MQITKFVHSCLLVETPERVAIFDPGVMSEEAFDFDRLERLDDIFITHEHADHCSVPFIKRLIEKFPEVRITTTPAVVDQLSGEGIEANATPPSGAHFFDSPHENVEPLFPIPEEVGVHYLAAFSHPGDSHGFSETMPILALPVTAPWGATVKAINLAFELKPQHVLPIHDWHWSDAARAQMYARLEQVFGEQDIQFYPLETGEPVEIDLSGGPA